MEYANARPQKSKQYMDETTELTFSFDVRHHTVFAHVGEVMYDVLGVDIVHIQ